MTERYLGGCSCHCIRQREELNRRLSRADGEVMGRKEGNLDREEQKMLYRMKGYSDMDISLSMSVLEERDASLRTEMMC